VRVRLADRLVGEMVKLPLRAGAVLGKDCGPSLPFS
jgi:hypothetical protein